MRASTASTGTGRRASGRSAPRSTMRVRLLAPFDPVVWDRRRFELFWGWPYRFEAYTPLAKRKLGYYALPMLWRDRVVGWANLSVRDGVLQHELGYAEGRPADASFATGLDAELDHVRHFLGLAAPRDSHGQHRRARSPELRRPRGRDHEPAQGPLSRGRRHEARSRALLPRRVRRRAAGRRRPPQRPGPLSERHRRRVLLPEACPGIPARVDRGGVAALPVRPDRGGSRPARRRRARLDGQPGVPRAASAPGAGRRSRSPGRAARRSRSGARRRVAADPAGRAGRARRARRSRPDRLAEDVGLARHPRLDPHRPPLDLRSGAPRGAGAGARGRAPGAGAGDEQVVEGRAPGRLPRLQPERQGSHRRRRLLGAAEAGRARLGAADVGRDRRLRSARLHAADDAGAVRRGRRSPRRHRRSAVLARGAARAVRARRARRPRRRALAAALSQAGRRAVARRAVARPQTPDDSGVVAG